MTKSKSWRERHESPGGTTDTIARRFNGGFRQLKSIESRRDERKLGFVRAISAAPSGLSHFVFTPTVKTVGCFLSLGLALRRAHTAGGACARPPFARTPNRRLIAEIKSWNESARAAPSIALVADDSGTRPLPTGRFHGAGLAECDKNPSKSPVSPKDSTSRMSNHNGTGGHGFKWTRSVTRYGGHQRKKR